MRPVFTFALVMMALALHPALAQSPSTTTMPPGAQNPAIAQPRLVAPPPPAQLIPPPPLPAPTAGPQPDAGPSALIIPGGAGGLCECLNGHNLSASVFDKTKMHQRCLGSV